MTNTVTVKLDETVTHDGKTYETLTFRKLKAKDLVAQDMVQGDVRRAFALYASMASVSVGVIEELDMEDFEKIGDAVGPLMGKLAAAAVAKAQTDQTAAR